MNRKELMQWALAVVLVTAAFAILKWGPGVPKANAAEGTQSTGEDMECVPL